MDKIKNALKSGDKRLSVAPMIDWTTRDYRTFARLFNPFVYLYTEMISTSAILHGDGDHHLRFYDNESPVVLQLGGSDPKELKDCVKQAQAYGYSEINLNVGCPSDRVQHNKIGACLMAEPTLVGGCIKAMASACDLPISVKHRIGIDSFDNYEFMVNFVETVANYGCTHFIVHARTAWLQGLSPKQNREIPPLRYDDVYRLKQDFPELYIEINGGITSLDEISTHLKHVDGVMIGRAAYHNPYLLAKLNTLWDSPVPTYRKIVEKLLEHITYAQNLPNPPALISVARHYLGLFQGLTGARQWRQALSGKKNLTIADLQSAAEVTLQANNL